MLSQLTQGDSLAQQGHAKSIDYTPDITSDSYWDAHHICAVRITEIGKTDVGLPYFTYSVTTQISEGPMEQTRTIKVQDLWFGRDVDEPHLKVDEKLILYYAKYGPSPIAVTVLDSQGLQQLGTLQHIAHLRANRHDATALMNDVFHKQTEISFYCLNNLMKRTPLQASADYVSRLLAFREEDLRDAQVRILASQLADKLRGTPGSSDAEYVWLATSLTKSRKSEWTEIRPFVDRLLEFSGKRTESVSLFVNLALDPSAGEAVRIAAYSAFDDPRLFRFEQPDSDSERIFHACMRMLKDREPLMRAAGAALLQNISTQVSPPHRSKYLEQSIAAIRSAIAVEVNETTRQQMRHYLKVLSN